MQLLLANQSIGDSWLWIVLGVIAGLAVIVAIFGLVSSRRKSEKRVEVNKPEEIQEPRTKTAEVVTNEEEIAAVMAAITAVMEKSAAPKTARFVVRKIVRM